MSAKASLPRHEKRIAAFDGRYNGSRIGGRIRVLRFIAGDNLAGDTLPDGGTGTWSQQNDIGERL
jgi:hypothetical protein